MIDTVGSDPYQKMAHLILQETIANNNNDELDIIYDDKDQLESESDDKCKNGIIWIKIYSASLVIIFDSDHNDVMML